MAVVEWWTMALMIAMVAVVAVGVFFRYVLDASLTWYDEFASYLLVWLSFYGAVVATWRGRHIRFDTLVERAGPRARLAMAVASEAFSLVVQAVLLVYGVVLVRAVGRETAVSIEAVPMGWVYSVLPISGGLMTVLTLVRLGALLAGHPVRERGPSAVSAVSGE